ncbi:3-(methylthio)propionyl-CoA ligase [Pseudoduganella namucuonensis]|uniref:Fatty-acyl-CoA synthase n=1 Tax=Pseudoduganella namucuonensis TaxID=1035707 RepID=A0A1I7IYH2_9BURK|nr:3-(methylthio)propionyl-CoA ligase [Pseudoduganella namucuonensis]SFU77986.1 fatty-acyl-CoA synthase [Pseudoduganella namucuonensis]
MYQHVHSPLPGQMMRRPLLISSILRHADRHFGDREIVSRQDDGSLHRYTYRDCHSRSRKLAGALAAMDVRMGDRVGTLAWNGHRHLELYYAVSGSGAVIHTINPRLHAEQLAFIINDAGDQHLFFERSFAPLVKSIAPRCPNVKSFILLDRDAAGIEGIPRLVCYEDLIAARDDDYTWPVFDEDAASGLCYTSGTTGNPKGVLYSHRSTMLHSYASVAPDMLNLSARDCVMPVVPMFHVNAWGLPYSAALVGAKLVLPGPALDGASLHELFEREGVTFSAGVPTIWLGLLNHVRGNGLRFSTFARTVIGGSACPPALMDAFRDDYGVQVIHAFGMTEISPIATVCTLQAHHAALPPAEQRLLLQAQGRVPFGVDMKIVDDDGAELPWDGQTFGHLMVRGPWVVDAYFQQPPGSAVVDGWFPTGDVSTISADGYMRITDRSKDLIKSGGEWIGSIDLENIAMAHASVLQAACVAVAHPKWEERPLLVVVRKPGCALERDALLAHFEGKVARWWIPDDVVFVDSLPMGPTGKVQKNRIRERYRDHLIKTTSENRGQTPRV